MNKDPGPSSTSEMLKRNPDVLCLPELSLPECEAEHLWRLYRDADVILEYGSGGSTALAAMMPNKFLITVENDLDWLLNLRRSLESCNPPSLPIFYHVDTGPTGAWGRPVNAEAWSSFHTYPLRIWTEPWFPQPDVVLIDGRFRPGCLAAVLSNSEKPMTVLFDDYTNRPSYHLVEKYLQPDKIIGRMAQFSIKPAEVEFDRDDFVSFFTHATYSSKPSLRYQTKRHR